MLLVSCYFHWKAPCDLHNPCRGFQSIPPSPPEPLKSFIVLCASSTVGDKKETSAVNSNEGCVKAEIQRLGCHRLGSVIKIGFILIETFEYFEIV